ncbi:MAG: hypothetical protein HZB56_10845 [Deltaproteobacteria bacterium]|nr:hypothetical protein [Deltaproteobacteria bacterium]
MGRAFAATVDRAALRALNYAPELRGSAGRRGPGLGELLAELAPAYGQVFTRIDCEPEHGVELLSQSDMFAAEPQGRVIRRDSMPVPERHLVSRWQVLIAGAGTLGETELYGRSIVADARLAGKYVGPHAVVLTFTEPESDQTLFAYAYLLSRNGIAAVRATSYGTKVLGVRFDLLRSLRLPEASTAVQRRVAHLVRQAVEGREAHLERVQHARGTLLSAEPMAEAARLCAKRSRKAVAWREPLPTMVAWNCASAGEALPLLRRASKTRLRDVLADGGVFRGDRAARVTCESPHGIDFYSQRDVFLARPVPRRVVQPDIDADRLFARPGTLLAGGHGTLGEGEIFGRVVMVTRSMERVGMSEDLLRIRTRSEHAAVVYTFLSSVVGLRLLRSTAVGTKLLSMRPDLVAELPFPEVSSEARATIDDDVTRAMAAREAADAAETEAIRIMEEEVVPSWLA